MRLYRRGGVWWVDIRHSSLVTPLRRSAHTRILKEARAFGQKLEAEIVEGKKPRLADTLRFEDMVEILRDYYVAENKLSALRHLPLVAGYLGEAFGGWKATDISSDAVAEYAAKRLKTGAAKGTINNELTMLSAMFTRLLERELIAKKPIIKQYRLNNAKQGFVSKAEFYAIHAHLPDWMKDYAEWLYISGNRGAEARTYERRDIDLIANVARIRPENDKSRRGRDTPLGTILRGIAERWLANARPDCPFLFHRDGCRLHASVISTTWKEAAKKVGLGHITPHDLRRTAVRDFVRAGVPEGQIMKLIGHTSRAMLDRYDIHSGEDRANAMAARESALGEQPSVSVVVPLRKVNG